MDFKEFNYLKEIWKQQNISKAAKALSISQPSLSKYLQNIEQKYNVRLFKRTGKQMVLTYAGERYLEIALKILSLADNINTDYFSGDEPKYDKLRVIVPPEKGLYVPYIIKEFRKRYPQTNLVINETSVGNVEKLLLNDEIDIVLNSDRINNEEIYQEKIFDEEILLVTSAKHPCTKEGIWSADFSNPLIDIKKFKHDEFILLLSGEQAKIKIENLFKRENINPHILIITNNISLVVWKITNGDCVCLVHGNSKSIFPFTEEIKIFSLGDHSLKIESYFTCRKNGYMSQKVAFFLNYIKTISTLKGSLIWRE